MKNKKERRLDNYLRQGKTICGSKEVVDETNRHRTILVCMRVNKNSLFEVDLEEYYSEIDVSDLNLRDQAEVFTDIELAISFIETQTQVKFVDMNVV